MGLSGWDINLLTVPPSPAWTSHHQYLMSQLGPSKVDDILEPEFIMVPLGYAVNSGPKDGRFMQL
jgi:hypothetical protein